MTRLRAKDIRNITTALEDYDAHLVKKTGETLRQIACLAVGIDEEEVRRSQDNFRVSVIPITSGQGIIDGFASVVESITRHLGFPSSATQKTDVSGLGEAFEKAANIIMLADDHSFLAINLARGRVVDNAGGHRERVCNRFRKDDKGAKGKRSFINRRWESG